MDLDFVVLLCSLLSTALNNNNTEFHWWWWKKNFEPNFFYEIFLGAKKIIWVENEFWTQKKNLTKKGGQKKLKRKKIWGQKKIVNKNVG